MATIEVRWASPLLKKASSATIADMMYIYLDKRKVGTIGNEERGRSPKCTIEVSPGSHIIYGRALFLFSNEITFNIDEHETLKFRCSEKPHGFARNTLGMVVLAAQYAIPGQVLRIDMEKN